MKKLLTFITSLTLLCTTVACSNNKDNITPESVDSNISDSSVTENNTSTETEDGEQIVDVFEGIVVSAEGIYPNISVNVHTNDALFSKILTFDYSLTHVGTNSATFEITAPIEECADFFEEYNYVAAGDLKTYEIKREDMDTYLISDELLTAEIKEQLLTNMKTELSNSVNRYNESQALLNGLSGNNSENQINAAQIDSKFILAKQYVFVPSEDAEYANPQTLYPMITEASTGFFNYVAVFQNTSGQAYTILSTPIVTVDGSLSADTKYDTLGSDPFPDINAAVRAIEERLTRCQNSYPEIMCKEITE